MPQAADAGDPTGLTKTPEAGAVGAINYIDPTPADVKQERWERLAGLIK